jgi:hypothetical protein
MRRIETASRSSPLSLSLALPCPNSDELLGENQLEVDASWSPEGASGRLANALQGLRFSRRTPPME